MMNNSYLVSVIIPCYNYADYIAETLESILSQTYSHWEVIVVDDGSVDSTSQIVAGYVERDSRIQYHYQQNQGLSAARNKGISLARGEYIQLLDADDFIAKTKLEIQVDVLSNNEGASLVYGDTYIFTHELDVNTPRKFRKFTFTMPPMSGRGGALAVHMAPDNIFLPGGPLFKRSMAENIGQFNKSLFSLEDWDFWYRAVLKGYEFVYDNREGTEFYARSHGNNMSGNRYKMWKYKIQARQSLIQIIKRMMQNNADSSFNLKVVLAKHNSLLYEEQARFNLLFGDVGRGIINTVRYSIYGEKPLRIWYDSAYWIKERLLGNNKNNS